MKDLNSFAVLSVDGFTTILLFLLVLAILAYVLLRPIKALFKMKFDVSKYSGKLLGSILYIGFFTAFMFACLFPIGFEDTSHIPTSQKWIYQFHEKFPYNAKQAEHMKNINDAIELWH